MSLMANPVLVRECRARMRGVRVFVVLAAMLSVMALTLFFVHMETTRHRGRIGYRRAVGAQMLLVLTIVQGTLIGLVTPAFGCGAFTLERERRTFDLLTSTTLRPRQIVLGKAAGSMYYVLLLVVASLPLMTFCILFGGLSVGQVVSATIILLSAAAFYASVGVWVSARTRHTVTSTAVAYSIVLLLVYGLPFGVWLIVALSRLRRGFVELFVWAATLNPILPLVDLLSKETSLWISRNAWVHFYYLTPALHVGLSAVLLLHVIARFRTWALRDEPGRGAAPEQADAENSPE